MNIQRGISGIRTQPVPLQSRKYEILQTLHVQARSETAQYHVLSSYHRLSYSATRPNTSITGPKDSNFRKGAYSISTRQSDELPISPPRNPPLHYWGTGGRSRSQLPSSFQTFQLGGYDCSVPLLSSKECSGSCGPGQFGLL